LRTQDFGLYLRTYREVQMHNFVGGIISKVEVYPSISENIVLEEKNRGITV